MLNLPIEFLNRMKTILGDEFEDFLKSLNSNENKGIFVNNNKISVENFKKIVDFSISPIEYDKNGFFVDNEKRGKHPLHHAGAFYVQDPSAMFTVNAVKFRGDELVLDMCASPGGKTIQIANRLDCGLLVSNEINFARCKTLYSNVERMGLRNVVITNDTPSNLAQSYANTFDVCLVDAPCSGEGMFRRGQEVVNEWNEKLNTMCAKRQLEILESANRCLKQGGIIIYSTCTYSLEENEGVVNEFLSRHDYKLIKIKHNFPTNKFMPEAVRIYPHTNKGEGQFVAVLKKQEQNSQPSGKALTLKQNKKANEFLNGFVNYNFNLFEYKNKIYNIKMPEIIKKDVNYFSLGVLVLEEKSNRFVPNHYLFSAFGQYFKNQIDLNFNSLDALAYLKGESLNNVNFKDYGVVMFNSCPVGGFKISDGKFKNYYPKGLRNG